jgi:hypothetical protein
VTQENLEMKEVEDLLRALQRVDPDMVDRAVRDFVILKMNEFVQQFKPMDSVTSCVAGSVAFAAMQIAAQDEQTREKALEYFNSVYAETRDRVRRGEVRVIP